MQQRSGRNTSDFRGSRDELIPGTGSKVVLLHVTWSMLNTDGGSQILCAERPSGSVSPSQPCSLSQPRDSDAP